MKLNHLMEQLPHGAVVPQAWLDQHGVTSGAACRLASSDWLMRVGHGAYSRKGVSLTWEGAVFGLQYGDQPAAVPRIWPGGLTALELAGLSHYLNLGCRTVQLFGKPGVRMPRWFTAAEWGVEISYSSSDLFDESVPDDFVEYVPAISYSFWISTPERAVLEWLNVLSDELLFGDAVVDTFSGLSTLRPARLQSLLERCKSVRVKRVFMVLARESRHVWYERLDRSSMNLGKGKRQVFNGGRLDKEYFVTVPERFVHGV